MAGDTVSPPGVGPVKKKYAYAGIAVVGAAILYYYYKKKSASSSTPAASTGADPYPPDGTIGNPQDLYSTDPATGQTYGDEQAGFIGTGGVGGGASPSTSTSGDAYPWDGTYNNPNDPYSMDTQTGSTYGDQGGGNPGGQPGGNGPPFATNSAWSQYIIQYWTSNSIGSVTDITDALGAYLSGSPMTTTQQDLVNQAIAIAGQVPVPSASGYPPSMHVSGGNPGGSVTNPPTGLKLSAKFTNITGIWNSVVNATGYQVTVTEQKGAKQVASATVTGTTYTAGGLQKNTSYAMHVVAEPAASGATPAVAYITTQK